MKRLRCVVGAVLVLALSCVSAKVGERVPVEGSSGLRSVEFACYGME